MALNGLFCADVPLRNYSLTHSLLSSRPSSISKCCLLENREERLVSRVVETEP